MRIQPALLLVLVALTVPLVVEARTMLVWVGVELSIGQSLAFGLVLAGGLVAWALWPVDEDEGNGSSDPEPSR